MILESISLFEADGLAGRLNAGINKCDCNYMSAVGCNGVAFPNRMELTNKIFAERPKQ
jgi:hypothetical protein